MRKSSLSGRFLLLLSLAIGVLTATAQAQSADYLEAVRTGDLKALKKYVDMDPGGVNGRRWGAPLLVTAAGSGQLKSTVWLLEQGADINAADGDGYTALHRAADHNHLQIMELLVLNRANVNAQSGRRYTPLHQCRSREAVVLLVKAKADVNAIAQSKRSPLIWAAQNKRTQAALALISSGAKLNLQDDYQCTALHRAIWADDKPLVEALLAKRAKTSLRNREGLTALGYAKKRGNKEIIRLLQDNTKGKIRQ